MKGKSILLFCDDMISPWILWRGSRDKKTTLSAWMGTRYCDSVFVGLQACDYCRVGGNADPFPGDLFSTGPSIFQVFTESKIEPGK